MPPNIGKCPWQVAGRSHQGLPDPVRRRLRFGLIALLLVLLLVARFLPLRLAPGLADALPRLAELLYPISDLGLDHDPALLLGRGGERGGRGGHRP